MDYDIAVSPEQLISSADSLRAMADDCVDALPAAPPAESGEEPDSPAAQRPHRAQDEVAATGTAAAAALLGAVRQVDRAVRGSSETLRATAADYQTTEHDASELITRTIGNALGELR